MERQGLQAYVDKIFEELEQKAPLINEQKAEYERLLVSHSNLTSQLEKAIGEHQQRGFELQASQAEVKRAKKESDSFLNQVKDLSKQVQTLLNEQGCRSQTCKDLRAASPSWVRAADGSAGATSRGDPPRPGWTGREAEEEEEEE